MTNNIVAQFACSLNSDGTFKEYAVVTGSVFNEAYNETLDSATLVLSQVALSDRLVNIKPYDYCRVYDKSSWNENEQKYDFDKLFLVDSFQEKENNIDEHIFGYTINLMSETKILEKFQCPNLTITHKINEDGTLSKKSIYYHITKYMDMFVAKMKFSSDGESWAYVPVITYPDQYETDGVTETEFYKRFNVPCADLAFSTPTLRQAITMLMQQVGCIPVVRNRVLSFLDFQKDGVPFGGPSGDYTLGHTVNRISRSLSSDSYVNTLTNISSNVLDSENEVVCETLGFRDQSNPILKQSGLFLETVFPIYKVNKFYVNYFVDDCILQYPNLHGFVTDISNYRTDALGTGQSYKQVEITAFTLSTTSQKTYVYFRFLCNVYECVLKNIKFYPLNSYNQPYLDENGEPIYKTFPNKTLRDSSNPNYSTNDYFWEEADINCVSEGVTFFVHAYIVFEADITYATAINGQGIAIETNTIKFNFLRCDYNINKTNQGPFLIKRDITELLVEQSVRQYLNTDFKEMVDLGPSPSLEELSGFLYGTLGYSIGSNRISGFSNVYQVGSGSALGWLTYNYTYIENIMNVISQIPISFSKEQIIDLISGLGIPYMEDFEADLEGKKANNVLVNPSNQEIYMPTNTTNYTSLTFDIYYQPLNSFNISFVKSKEPVDFTIEQYDGNASGLTDFDRLSIHEQEQVDRIGNETLSINQRTSNLADIKTFENGPLIFKEDTNRDGQIGQNDNGIEYVIFNRSFSINNYYYNVTYTGSKDAVLKDYFTSIRTKYRGYQYIDYSQSVLRKEKDVVFIKISSEHIYADDKIHLGNWSQNKNSYHGLTNFIYDFSDIKNVKYLNQYKVKYACERGLNSEGDVEIVKADVSAVTNSNSLSFIYELKDNVGNGAYISNPNYSTINDYKAKIGGIPQSWQIWGEDYNISHNVFFVNDINFYNSDFFETNVRNIIDNNTEAEEKADDVWENASLIPIVDSDLIDVETGSNILFTIESKDLENVHERYFYKDYAERINYTTQFIYYTDSEDILWSEAFISCCALVLNTQTWPNALFGSTEFILNSEEHEIGENDEYLCSTDGTTEEGEITLNNGNLMAGYPSQHGDGWDVAFVYDASELFATSDDLVIDYTNWENDSQVSITSPNIYYDEKTHLITFFCVVRDSQDVDYLQIKIPYTRKSYYGLSDYIQVDKISNLITINWHQEVVLKVCYANPETGLIKDVVVFRRPDSNVETTTYFLSLNDTKSDYVMSEKEGILYRRYKIRSNSIARDVDDIYNEED